MDRLFIIIVLCYILRNLGIFLFLCLMDKARFISLSFLSLSLLSICVPFVPLSFLSLSCSPICPVASTVLLLSYPSAPSISIYLCPSLFILSVSLKLCVSYLRLIPTPPGSNIHYIVAETAAVPVTSVEVLEREKWQVI